MLKFVLVNDDGIEADGLKALFRACKDLGRVVVVAPDAPRSGSGHAVTTRAPITFAERSQGWISVDGTPADCTRVALTHVTPDADWVVAGINRGGNLGADSYVSGTLAAAREAALLGRRALALSQYVAPDREVDWDWSARQARRVVDELLGHQVDRPGFWNVNLPHNPAEDNPAIVHCGLDANALNVSFRVDRSNSSGTHTAHFDGDYHSRPRTKDRDVDVCFGGRVAVTRIPLDLTG